MSYRLAGAGNQNDRNTVRHVVSSCIYGCSLRYSRYTTNGNLKHIQQLKDFAKFHIKIWNYGEELAYVKRRLTWTDFQASKFVQNTFSNSDNHKVGWKLADWFR